MISVGIIIAQSWCMWEDKKLVPMLKYLESTGVGIKKGHELFFMHRFASDAYFSPEEFTEHFRKYLDYSKIKYPTIKVTRQAHPYGKTQFPKTHRTI